MEVIFRTVDSIAAQTEARRIVMVYKHLTYTTIAETTATSHGVI